MSEESIQRHLRELRGELGRDRASEPETRELLRDLAQDIDRALEADERSGLVDRLRSSVVQFEAEHPDLALFTARIIDQLVKLGV
jgi:hypothetical protein